MTPEYLLDSIGLLDDELIREAERPAARRRGVNWARWGTMAACLALIVALGRLLPMLPGAPKDSGGSCGGAGSPGAADSSATAEQPPQDTEPPGETEGDLLMVDGALYRSTGRALPGEVAEEAVLGTTSYVEEVPETDGQANFAPDGAPYARTADGIVVLLDGEWILFLPDTE